MEKIKKLFTAFIFALVLSVFAPHMGMQNPATVEAASKAPSCAKTQTVYLTTNDGVNYMQDISSPIFIKNLSDKAKITNLKSSNKKIIAYSGLTTDPVSLQGKYVALSVNSTGLKPGAKSTISFTVKQNGKSYRLSCKITVKLRPTVFKTLSIGGKNYASKFKGISVGGTLKPSKKTGTFTVKMASGKKLTKITLLRSNGDGKSTIKTIKNGSKVTFKKGDIVCIDYTNTKKPANYNYTGDAYGFRGGLVLALYDTITFTIK